MTKFKVEIVKRNGRPRCSNKRPDNYPCASYQAIPSIEEWFAISENFDEKPFRHNVRVIVNF